ncbi:MAG TPA: winged helix DNA-binding domain-containing protein [Ilumatobacteraceae bacterium]|nr:winged helix DNA-binding domain-containing protein [Ilumatobacteraceae bacterium]
MLRVTDDHRRARIARRHGLQADHRYDDIGTATTAMTALHATEPTTPHLALHARVRELTVDDVEAALYDERSLVKVMAMRRTLFVVTRELLPAVAGCAGRRVAEAEGRRLAKEAGVLGGQLGADWIAAASTEIVERLTGAELSARELRGALPHLGGTFTSAPGTKWSAEVSTMSRLLTILAAAGDVVRGRNAGHWRISRPLWTSMASWLGEEMTPSEPGAGCVELVGHWLWTFGPATEADLVWWLGSTKAIVRKALLDVEAVEVVLEGGSTGWVLPTDTADLEAPARAEPWVALLPTLDPTTMGWRERAFYLDPAHTPYLFDSAGNAGTTVWVDGRIVGCWVQDEEERVRLIVVEEISRDARRLLDAEASRLDEFLRGAHITNVFASPQMKQMRLG